MNHRYKEMLKRDKERLKGKPELKEVAPHRGNKESILMTVNKSYAGKPNHHSQKEYTNVEAVKAAPSHLPMIVFFLNVIFFYSADLSQANTFQTWLAWGVFLVVATCSLRLLSKLDK